MGDEGLKEDPGAGDLHPSSFIPHPLPSPSLSRQLGLFGTTMAVMGGIIGAGIFINPYLVAERLQSAPLILGAWIAGGLIALAGGFIYAELAARMPVVGGQYAYLREAFHPAVAFTYGWVLLLVIQTGGMAAVAVTFARYFLELTQWPASTSFVAAGALGLLTAINCLGVRAGSRLQSVLTLTAIGAIALFEAVSFWKGGASQVAWRPLLDRPASLPLVLAFGAAMTPVLFAYGGWQTASFLGGEVRQPRRTLPRGLIFGGAGRDRGLCLGQFRLPARARRGRPGAGDDAGVVGHARFVRRARWGADRGRDRDLGLRVSRAIDADGAAGLFRDGAGWRVLSRRGWVHPRTRVPVIAIVLQGVWAIVIALAGTYAQVVNYVIAMDCIFFGLTAVCLFVLRWRESAPAAYRVPGHPWTTLLFIAAQWLIMLSTFAHDPKRAFIGLGIALAGLPVYFFWRGRL